MCVCVRVCVTIKSHVRQYSRQEGGRGRGVLYMQAALYTYRSQYMREEGGGTVQEEVLYMQEVLYT